MSEQQRQASPSPIDDVAPSLSSRNENNESKSHNTATAMERNHSIYTHEEIPRHSPTGSERERDLMSSFNYKILPVGLPPLIRDPS
jgi:hypothetical protein